MADFDPAKEAINRSKHGVSLARWIDLEVFAIVRDDRFDYGEPRYRERYRPISLRRAHAKEMKRYAPKN
ncbi:MAG TPA: BrnT family toxin [Bradyrhizobium sp.]|jgi:hypothetical protein|nr:BrnT family toxin [Bradyrhizobium sp.]